MNLYISLHVIDVNELGILFIKLISFCDTILMKKIKISKKLLTLHLTGGIDYSQGGDKDEFV